MVNCHSPMLRLCFCSLPEGFDAVVSGDTAVWGLSAKIIDKLEASAERAMIGDDQ